MLLPGEALNHRLVNQMLEEAEQQNILVCLSLSLLPLSCLVGVWLIPTSSGAGHSLAMSSLPRRAQLFPAPVDFSLHIWHESPAFSRYFSDRKLWPLLQPGTQPFLPWVC